MVGPGRYLASLRHCEAVSDYEIGACNISLAA